MLTFMTHSVARQARQEATLDSVYRIPGDGRYISERQQRCAQVAKKILVIVCLGASLAGFGGAAFAHGRSHFDFYVGTSSWWGPPPYYRRFPYYPPYYYEPQTIIIEREPMVYIQQPPVAATGQTPVWQYCTDPPGYYPYVQSCRQAWIPVDPRTVAPPAK